MHERGKPIAVMVVVSLLGMLFAGSFLGSLHHLEPHEVPVAVVAPEQAVDRLGGMLDRRSDGAFDLTAYENEREAQEALLEREVDGVFVPGQGGAELIVAGANGQIENNALTEVFHGVGQATGQPVAVKDVRPLPADDSAGVSSIFFVIVTVIPAVVLAVALAFAAPRAGAARRIGLLSAGSILVGGATAWVAAGLTGALAGAPWELWGFGALLVFTVSSVTAGALRVAGPPAAGLFALLIIPIGVPASGGPIGPQFIPRWYAALGEWLPVSAAIDAVRNTVYFDGNALATPLLVLGLWLLAGIALVLIPKRARRRSRAAAMEPATGS